MVIGAGQAGLAAGYHLQRAGHSFSILEATAQPGGSWPHYAPLGALDVEGRALHRHGVHLMVPGLYFMGLSNQHTFASATLRGVGSDAAVVVRHLTRHLAPARRAFIPAGLRLAATQICCPTR